MSSLTDRIADAWKLRINLRTEECLAVIAELKHTLGLPSGELSSAQIEASLLGDNLEDTANVLVLSSYLLRQIGEEAAAERMLTELDQRLKNRGLYFFEVAYERGMSLFLKGDFGHALEHFLRASLLAKNTLHRLWGRINALLCMENLGIGYEKTLAEVEQLVEEAAADADVERVRRQLFALRLRELFRQGKFAEVLQTDALRTDSDLDQARYFGWWLRGLPYHTSYRPVESSELGRLLDPKPGVHHRAYRLRTLQGVSHPQDARIAKPSEWVDRLYLWVWQWLRDPQALPVQKITPLLVDIECDAISHRLTLEDYQLVRNAVLWLSLFDPRANKTVERFLNALRNHGGNDFALLQLEMLVVSYFTALRDGKESVAEDYRGAMRAHPLWHSAEVGFRDLVEAVDVAAERGPVSKELVGLAERLAHLIHGEKSSARLYVDLNRCVVHDKLTDKRIVSQPLCLGLHLLHQRPIVRCEEFLEVTFGITRFDPTCHNSKIFNLLARLRTLTGNEPRFRMKEGAVVCDGSWRGITFSKALANGFADYLPEWSAPTPEKQSGGSSRRRPGFDTLIWGAGLTRGQIEEQLGIPRSTTNRWLARWIREGRIRREGQSRQSVYCLNRVVKARRELEESA